MCQSARPSLENRSHHSGDDLQESGQQRGMLIDFGDLKKAVRNLADSFDHALIYEENTLKPKTIEALNDEHFKLIPVRSGRQPKILQNIFLIFYQIRACPSIR